MKKHKKGMCAFLATLLVVASAMSFAACDFDGGSGSGAASGYESVSESDTDSENTTVPEISSDESLDESIIGHEHTYKISIEKSPSRTSEGIAKAVCEECGDGKIVILPKYDSEHYKVDGLKNIECAVGGTICYSISVYGETIVFKDDVKAGHFLNGAAVYDGEEITFNGDDIPKSVTVFGNESLSCLKATNAAFRCDVCGDSILFQARLEHTPKNGWSDDLKIYSDCELGGKSKEFVCATCGEAVSVNLPPRAHDFEYRLIDGEEEMTLQKTCRLCGKRQSSKAMNIVVTEEVPSKCNAEGYKVCTVLVDGQTISVKIVTPKTGHKFFGKEADYSDGTIFYIEDGAKVFGNEYVPYCTDTYETGLNGYFECSDCGQYMLVTVRRHLAPTDVSKITYKDGFKAYICEKCGKEVNERV